MINIKENIKSVEEFNLLYDDVGWGAYDDNITQKALDNTFYSVRNNRRYDMFFVYTRYYGKTRISR